MYQALPRVCTYARMCVCLCVWGVENPTKKAARPDGRVQLSPASLQSWGVYGDAELRRAFSKRRNKH